MFVFLLGSLSIEAMWDDIAENRDKLLRRFTLICNCCTERDVEADDIHRTNEFVSIQAAIGCCFSRPYLIPKCQFLLKQARSSFLIYFSLASWCVPSVVNLALSSPVVGGFDLVRDRALLPEVLRHSLWVPCLILRSLSLFIVNFLV